MTTRNILDLFLSWILVWKNMNVSKRCWSIMRILVVIWRSHEDFPIFLLKYMIYKSYINFETRKKNHGLNTERYYIGVKDCYIASPFYGTAEYSIITTRFYYFVCLWKWWDNVFNWSMPSGTENALRGLLVWET